MSHCLTTLLTAALLSIPATADDFYVDALHGNNSNSGRSPQTAWQSLVFAVATVNGTVPHTIHLLPGMHMVGGDLIGMTASISIVGDAGRDATSVHFQHLSGHPSGFFIYESSGPPSFPNLAGISIHALNGAIWAYVPVGGESEVRVEDVDATCTFGPIVGSSNFGHLTLRLSRCRIRGGPGVSVGGALDFTLEDSLFVDCWQRAVSLNNLTSLPGAPARVDIIRTQIVDTVAPGGSYGNALMLSGDIASQVRVVDCLIARADTYGIRADGLTPQFEVIRSTIVDCGHTGFASGNNQTLHGSIVSRNTRDVSGPLSVENSIVTDGSAIGPGVLAVDPRFVNAPGGDYRLRSSSPAIDRLPREGLDLLGRPRQVDGNLDLLAAGDLGALEFHSLELAEPAVGGGNLVLDLWAAGASKAVLVLAPAPLAPMPALTAYGSLALDPLVAWRVFGVAPLGEPYALSVPLPAAAVGATWSAQSLITSNVAPFGAAFSNALEFTIVAP